MEWILTQVSTIFFFFNSSFFFFFAEEHLHFQPDINLLIKFLHFMPAQKIVSSWFIQCHYRVLERGTMKSIFCQCLYATPNDSIHTDGFLAEIMVACNWLIKSHFHDRGKHFNFSGKLEGVNGVVWRGIKIYSWKFDKSFWFLALVWLYVWMIAGHSSFLMVVSTVTSRVLFEICEIFLEHSSNCSFRNFSGD